MEFKQQSLFRGAPSYPVNGSPFPNSASNTVPSGPVVGPMRGFGTLNPSMDNIGGVPDAMQSEFPTSGELQGRELDDHVGEDGFIQPSTVVSQHRDVGAPRDGYKETPAYEHGMLLLSLNAPKREGNPRREMTNKRARHSLRDTSNAIPAVFNRISTDNTIDPTGRVTAATVLVSDILTETDPGNPVSHFATGVGETTTLQTHPAETVDRLVNADPELLDYLQRNVLPYSTQAFNGNGATLHQTAKSGDMLSVALYPVPDGGGMFKLEYIPLINITGKHAVNVTRLVTDCWHRSKLGDVEPVLNNVYNIGSLVTSKTRTDQEWRFGIVPYIYPRKTLLSL
jgi:hypothetical protein